MKLTLNSPVSTFLEFERLDTVYSQEGAHYLALHNLLELLTQYEELSDTPYFKIGVPVTSTQALTLPPQSILQTGPTGLGRLYIKTLEGFIVINSFGAWAETSRAPDSTPIFLPEQS